MKREGGECHNVQFGNEENDFSNNNFKVPDEIEWVLDGRVNSTGLPIKSMVKVVSILCCEKICLEPYGMG